MHLKGRESICDDSQVFSIYSTYHTRDSELLNKCTRSACITEPDSDVNDFTEADFDLVLHACTVNLDSRPSANWDITKRFSLFFFGSGKR